MWCVVLQPPPKTPQQQPQRQPQHPLLCASSLPVVFAAIAMKALCDPQMKVQKCFTYMYHICRQVHRHLQLLLQAHLFRYQLFLQPLNRVLSSTCTLCHIQQACSKTHGDGRDAGRP
jgi:hypothetical protein